MLGCLAFLAILGVIVSLARVANLIGMGSLVDLGSQAILLSLARPARQVNIAVVSKLRSLPRTTRGVSMGSLTGRASPARLCRLTIPPGAGCLNRQGSMTGIRRKTRLTISVRTTRLARLNNNTTMQNRPPRMIRLTSHTGNAGKAD